jgi:BMFP domain-containing protein YqiC
MSGASRILDDLAGVAGGALSALVGLRDEIDALIQAKLLEALRRLSLVRREEVDVLEERLNATQAEQEKLLAELAALRARLGALEERLSGKEPPAPEPPPGPL